jgi:hypothetical protein
MSSIASLTQDIAELEESLRALRQAYEKYFAGVERLEPLKDRDRLKKELQRLLAENTRNTARRFRLQTLQASLVTYEQYWNRITRQIEEGTFKRDRLRAQRLAGSTQAAREAEALEAIETLEDELVSEAATESLGAEAEAAVAGRASEAVVDASAGMQDPEPARPRSGARTAQAHGSAPGGGVPAGRPAPSREVPTTGGRRNQTSTARPESPLDGLDELLADVARTAGKPERSTAAEPGRNKVAAPGRSDAAPSRTTAPSSRPASSLDPPGAPPARSKPESPQGLAGDGARQAAGGGASGSGLRLQSQPAAAMGTASASPAVRQLHQAYLKARQELGEHEPVSIETFAATVEKQIAAIKSRLRCQDVELKVAVKDGRAVLKVVPR